MSINWAGVGLLAGLYGADQGVKIGRDYVSTELSKKLQANAADLNYKYSIESAKNMPSANRAGLETAGYNPMLAVQNSTSGANSSWTSSGSLSSQAGDSLSNAFSNVQDIQRLKNETKQADQNAKKLESESENLNADTANKLEENKFISEKRKQEIANIQADTLEKEARMDNMKKQIELGQMGITVQQEANAIQAEKNDIERKGNLFRTIRDFGDKYNWSPRQFGEELGRRYAKDHFGRFYKGQ